MSLPRCASKGPLLALIVLVALILPWTVEWRVAPLSLLFAPRHHRRSNGLSAASDEKEWRERKNRNVAREQREMAEREARDSHIEQAARHEARDAHASRYTTLTTLQRDERRFPRAGGGEAKDPRRRRTRRRRTRNHHREPAFHPTRASLSVCYRGVNFTRTQLTNNCEHRVLCQPPTDFSICKERAVENRIGNDLARRRRRRDAHRGRPVDGGNRSHRDARSRLGDTTTCYV